MLVKSTFKKKKVNFSDCHGHKNPHTSFFFFKSIRLAFYKIGAIKTVLFYFIFFLFLEYNWWKVHIRSHNSETRTVFSVITSSITNQLDVITALPRGNRSIYNRRDWLMLRPGYLNLFSPGSDCLPWALADISRSILLLWLLLSI